MWEDQVQFGPREKEKQIKKKVGWKGDAPKNT